MLILTQDDLCHHLLHQNKKKKVPEKFRHLSSTLNQTTSINLYPKQLILKPMKKTCFSFCNEASNHDNPYRFLQNLNDR